MDRPRPQLAERCDMCARELAEEHEHLLEPAERRLTCACGACAVLFSGQANERYRRVPRRVRVLADFRMTDGQWDALRLPINLAFFYYNTPQGRVIASYPSPAGATESLLSLESWADIQRENPVLASMLRKVWLQRLGAPNRSRRCACSCGLYWRRVTSSCS
jgi:hypothetical protein